MAKFYAGFFSISLLVRIKINFKNMKKVKVEKQISINFVTLWYMYLFVFKHPLQYVKRFVAQLQGKR